MENKKESDKKVKREAECYCCHKIVDESQGEWVSAILSGKCLDGTNAHKRFVCKTCEGTR